MSKFEKWNLSKSTFAYCRILMCKICMLRFHHMQKEDSHPSSFRQVYLFPILRNSPAGSPYPQEPPHNPFRFLCSSSGVFRPYGHLLMQWPQWRQSLIFIIFACTSGVSWRWDGDLLRSRDILAQVLISIPAGHGIQ